jgi:hypothetical protein
MRKFVHSLLASVVLASAFGAHAWAASPPTTPSLTGETLNGTVTQVSQHCRADGSGYYTFTASGTAAGPYTGTFTEQGVVLITLRNSLFYEQLIARFQIQSVTPPARIVGTKAEIPPETFPPPPGISCPVYNFGYTTIGNTQPNRYQATIRTGNPGSDDEGQTYQDSGTTDMTVLWNCNAAGVCAGGSIQESFVSNRGPVLQPGEDCHEGDGNGHFEGDNGKGHAQFDSDGCVDGDQNTVDSENRGDGQSFHSTSVDSVAFDSLTNTVTITGIGTSAGSVMAFVLVAAESTPLTPGWVSLSFSDGYVNTGSLTDGSVVLH